MKILLIIFCISILIYIGIYPSISAYLNCGYKKTKEEEFEISRHIINTLSFWIPSLTIYFMLHFFIKGIGWFIPLFPSAFIGMVGLVIGNNINIYNADALEISDDSPLVEDEKLKRKIGVVSIFTSGFSIFRHMRQNIKNVMNVDSWKEMK